MEKPDAIIGQKIGRFTVQKLLGRGAMARVYKGMDGNRPVAIKIMDETIRSDSTFVQRFQREADSAGQLSHNNIIKVHETGNHMGTLYQVMEFVDGTSLTAILHEYRDKREFMPHATVLRILLGIAEALDHAHKKGVIHRDVKPSNILIDKGGRPVLSDFGLALRTAEGTRGSKDSLGSLHYIAPEQARSSTKAVPQSDLYSLGIVAYEMLTNTLPFDDASPTALALKHVRAEVPSPRSFNKQLSSDVEAVLFKALAKQPENRYTSGVAFVADLRRALRGQPINTNTTSQRGGRRRLIAAIVGLLVLIAVGFAAFFFINRGTPNPTPETPGTVAVVADATVAETATEVVTEEVSTAGELSATEGTTAEAQVESTSPAPDANAGDSPDSTESVTPEITDSPVPSNATPAPADWLPVRFVYDNNGFYWFNDSDQQLSAADIVFESEDGSTGYEGERFAYWPMNPGRCIEIRFTGTGLDARPDDCNVSAYYNPARNLTNVQFWIGEGSFRVLWRGELVAVCENSAGECLAAVPG